MLTDDVIRDALDAIGDRAPDPGPLRARLAGRIRAHRQRRALLIAGAAAAATAGIGVPATVWLTGRRSTPPPSGNLPSPAPEPPAKDGNPRRLMRLRPTWLPDGFIEMGRQTQLVGPGQEWTWATPTALERLQANDLAGAWSAGIIVLNLREHPVAIIPTSYPPESPPVSPPPYDPLPGPPNVTIGGQPGHVRANYSTPGGDIEWLLGGRLVASIAVSPFDGADGVALRMAQGMVPNTTAAVECSLRFGWLPAQVDTGDALMRVIGVDGGWMQQMVAPAVVDGSVRAELSTVRSVLGDSPGENGEPATVRGRPGTATGGDSYGGAFVELDGRWLRVLSYTGQTPQQRRQDALRIADELVIGPDPYLGWIGTR